MKKIRFKKIKLNWRNFFEYILLIVLSSLIVVDLLIALPLTEKLTDIVAFDLNVAQDFWSKEYFLDLESDNLKDIQKTRNIISRRLNKYGVEEFSIYLIDNQDKVIADDTEVVDNDLHIIVRTTKPQIYVEELIRNPYQMSIVTRKEDVNFEDEEDPYAQYMGDNYNQTEFNNTSFRNIYIAKLPDSGGTDSYFGLAKTWPTNKSNFTKFLKEYNNQYIGIDIDGFVTPVYVSESNIFAIPLSADETSKDAIDILYNSGNIPTSYTISSQNIVETEVLDINYIEISVALFIIITVIYLYQYITKLYNKNSLVLSFISTILTISTMLTIYKITNLPINPVILLIQAIFVIVLTRALITNRESKYLITGLLFIISLIFNLIGIGYIKILTKELLTLSLLTLLISVFTEIYMNKISKYFKK
jgi:hypothetical protein